MMRPSLLTMKPEPFETGTSLPENGCYNKAQALTLSPISSPQKPYGGYSSLRETSPTTDVCGYKRKRRHGAFMESTSVSQPFSPVTRDQISQRTHQIRDSRVSSLSTRTPVKTQSEEGMGRSVSDEGATPFSPMSLKRMFTPIRNKLRKRDQQEFNNIISTTEKPVEDARGPRSFPTEDYTPNNTSIQAGGLPADQSEMLHQPKTPQSRPTLTKRCSVVLEKFPTSSPAKMFTYMKEKESKLEKINVHNSNRRELIGGGNVQESIDTSPSMARSMDEMEEDAPETPDPVNRDREDSADSRSETGGAEDVQIPAKPKHPILLEDPLVLNTPQISIPKKDKDVYKRSLWTNQENFPADSVIYLKKWSLGRNPKGLFVTGIHRGDNVLWNSSLIVDRVSQKVLKTVTGRVYVLAGRMNIHRDLDFPKSFLKKFEHGFPPNWNTLYEKMMSEPKNNETKKNKTPGASVNQSVKRQRQNSFRTPDSCPPASSTKVSRSGRLIKPPLEYWKGGRVILDVDMNVTIYECYDTFTSDSSSIASSRKKPTNVLQPRREDSKKTEKEEASQLVRKVRAVRNQNTAEVSRDMRPGNSYEPTREMFEIPKRPSYKTSSSQRHPHTRGAHEDGGFQNQGQPEHKQTDGTNRYPTRLSSRKQISACESPSSTENSSSNPSSDEEFTIKRRKQEKGVNRKKGVIVSNNTRPDRSLLSSKLSKKSREEPKQRGRTKRSNEANQKEGDANEWTKMELMKLKEAVSFYPWNITGFWTKVARMVGTRSAEECYKQHMSKGAAQSPEKCTKKPKKKKVEEPKPPATERPVISARAGTLKRKQQVRQFLEAAPREDVNDAFSSAYMQNKRVEVPSVCLSDEHEFTMSNLEPQTPMSSHFPEVKTPQCLLITPGMIGSPNKKNDDKVVYQLQKKMRKNQFNACRMTRSTRLTTPSVKRSIQRCTVENNDFAVWEMFPGNEEGLSDSDEQEDFYFSDA